VEFSKTPQPLFSLRTRLREEVKNSWCNHDKFMAEFEAFIASVA
jgi:hypothetical protein